MISCSDSDHYVLDYDVVACILSSCGVDISLLPFSEVKGNRGLLVIIEKALKCDTPAIGAQYGNLLMEGRHAIRGT